MRPWQKALAGFAGAAATAAVGLWGAAALDRAYPPPLDQALARSAEVIDRDGKVVKDNSRVIDKGQKINPTAAQTIHKLLVGVVTEGTGKPCNIAKWQVMGKTGTAQVPKIGSGRYEPDAYLGSFVAAAPASDPQVVVLVMIRKPKRSIGYYGSTVALPAAKTIMEGVLPYLNVPPDKTEPQKHASLARDPQTKYN